MKKDSVFTTGEIKEIIDNLYHTIGVRMYFKISKYPEYDNSFPVKQSSFTNVCKAITDHLELPISIIPFFNSDFKTKDIVANKGGNTSGIAAQVLIPNNLPWYKTNAMNNFPISVNIPFEALSMGHYYLMTQLSHEFSHIYLNSRRDPQKDSEWATDLCALMMGFSSLWIEGRKRSSTERTATHTITQTTTQGYLSDEEFTFALEYIETLRSPFERLRNQISSLTKKIKTTYDRIPDYIKNNYLLYAFHYKHPQASFKEPEDATVFSKMSQAKHKLELEELLTKSKKEINAIVKFMQDKKEFYEKDKNCMEDYVKTLNTINAKLEQIFKELIHDYNIIYRNIDIKHHTKIFEKQAKSLNKSIKVANNIIQAIHNRHKRLDYCLGLYKRNKKDSITNEKYAERLSLLCNTDYTEYSTEFIKKEQEKIDKITATLTEAPYFYSIDEEILLSHTATLNETVSALNYCLKEQKSNIKVVMRNLNFTNRLKCILNCLFISK